MTTDDIPAETGTESATDPTRLIAALADRDPTDPIALIAAALANPDAADLLIRAADRALTLRDRQAVAIATAHLQGRADLVDALARDHLADHPDDALVRWIAAHPSQAADPTRRRPQ